MIEAISAGIILVNENGSEKQFLLLNYPTGHWDFIKGGIEDGESLQQTAIRETREETGITDIEFIEGFKEEIEYFFRAENQNVHKKVIFFLAKTNSKNVILSHEHLDSVWLNYNDALKKLTYDNAINLLKKSNTFLLN
jgi:8-oxo-dGTP pyrophosphatase MutT (NUDIX family)|tara:strand:+ start:828 stop:1241 length:414 start_codon:yes stop_codon:yes gene_type:complete